MGKHLGTPLPVLAQNLCPVPQLPHLSPHFSSHDSSVYRNTNTCDKSMALSLQIRKGAFSNWMNGKVGPAP